MNDFILIDFSHAALILHSSILNSSAILINAINEFQLQCAEEWLREFQFTPKNGSENFNSHPDAGLYVSHFMGNNRFRRIALTQNSSFHLPS